MNCTWIFKPLLPYTAPIRRHVIGPAVRRAHRPLRHVALWVCSGGATLIPLPGPTPFAPVGTDAPIYGAAPAVPGIVAGFGALPGIVPTLPARGPLLDVPGPVLTSGALVSEVGPVSVPEPSSAVLFAAGLVVMSLAMKGITA